MLARILRQEQEKIVMKYEAYRLRLVREMDKRVQQEVYQNSAQTQALIPVIQPNQIIHAQDIGTNL